MFPPPSTQPLVIYALKVAPPVAWLLTRVTLLSEIVPLAQDMVCADAVADWSVTWLPAVPASPMVVTVVVVPAVRLIVQG